MDGIKVAGEIREREEFIEVRDGQQCEKQQEGNVKVKMSGKDECEE